MLSFGGALIPEASRRMQRTDLFALLVWLAARGGPGPGPGAGPGTGTGTGAHAARTGLSVTDSLSRLTCSRREHVVPPNCPHSDNLWSGRRDREVHRMYTRERESACRCCRSQRRGWARLFIHRARPFTSLLIHIPFPTGNHVLISITIGAVSKVDAIRSDRSDLGIDVSSRSFRRGSRFGLRAALVHTTAPRARITPGSTAHHGLRLGLRQARRHHGALSELRLTRTSLPRTRR